MGVPDVNVATVLGTAQSTVSMGAPGLVCKLQEGARSCAVFTGYHHGCAEKGTLACDGIT